MFLTNTFNIHPPRVLTLILAVVVGWAEDDGFVDHYIQVDLGTKWYEIQLHRNNTELRGQFDDSVVVTPTVRCRIGDQESNYEFILTGGLSYGSFIAQDLEVDSFEFHLGIGGAMKIAPWLQLDLMASVGRGYTWVDLPQNFRTWDNESSTWGYSSHGEAVATLSAVWHGIFISANAGYRVTSLTQRDPESDDHRDDYLIHGFVVGGAIGFTF